jgi:uncharacterized protein with HEPN domain
MPRNEADRLQDMRDAAREIATFVKGRSREDLDQDRQLMHALVRCLKIIGEAAGSIPEHTRTVRHEIPWEAIIGMRNRLIHGYFAIDLDILWNTATENIPPLLEVLDSLLGD